MHTQVLAELHELVSYRARYLGGIVLPILALGLSSRKNLCCHPSVSGKLCVCCVSVSVSMSVPVSVSLCYSEQAACLWSA
jgi:hypothetical protein